MSQPNQHDTVTDDTDLFSLALEVVTDRVVEAAEALDVERLQTVVDSGLLLEDVSERMVRAIWPVIDKLGYDKHATLIESWLEQCAKSNPDATAVIVFNVIMRSKTEPENMPKLLEHGLQKGVRIRQKLDVLSNRGDNCTLEDFSLPGILALNYSAGFRAIVEHGGWLGKWTEIPDGSLVSYGGGEPFDINLVELMILGHSPNDPNAAAVDLESVLDCLDLNSPAIKTALADCLVRVHKLGWLEPTDGVWPMDIAAMLIDAGCDLRQEVLELRVKLNEGDEDESLIHAICASQSRASSDTPTGPQFVHAARLLIEEGGMDPNGYSAAGFTTLQAAVRQDNIDMVEMLLEHGADPKMSKAGEPGIDALALARSLNHRAVASIIQAWNARQAVARAIGAAGGLGKGAS